MNERSLLTAALAAGVLAAAVAGSGAAAAQDANGETARPLSAFFGLDNALPAGANLLCQGAAGQDGMPVVLSHTVDAETLQPGGFRIVTQSGSERTPLCTTLRPAGDPGELRTGTTTTFCASIRPLRRSRSASRAAIWSTPIRT